jgi:hypothetical protein
MSELMNTRMDRKCLRRQLLSTVSAVTLLVSACSIGKADADDGDADRPTVWIELGGQIDRVVGGEEPFAAPFFGDLGKSLTSPEQIQKELPWSAGPEGKISFQPDGSDWVFSAAVRYGRTNSNRSTQQKTKPAQLKAVYTYQTCTPGGSSCGRRCCHTRFYTPSKAEYTDVDRVRDESHAVIDFQAGKDVGLGLFGHQGTSVFSAGVRFAQFNSKTTLSVKARTDLQRYNYWTPARLIQYPQKYIAASSFRNNAFSASATRSFRAVGPSISWDASSPLVGNNQSDISLDWGANAAVLFGRQKAVLHHQTTAASFHEKYSPKNAQLYTHGPYDHNRQHSVIVPNVGGFAGVSFRYSTAKISFGYRGDFFFGAMDSGIDTAHRENVSFYGPFASVSVGIGG